MHKNLFKNALLALKCEVVDTHPGALTVKFRAILLQNHEFFLALRGEKTPLDPENSPENPQMLQKVTQNFVPNFLIFAVGELCAKILFGDEKSLIIASAAHFFTPVDFENDLIFHAKIHKKSKKTDIFVEAFLLDIMIFSAKFSALSLHDEIFSLDPKS